MPLVYLAYLKKKKNKPPFSTLDQLPLLGSSDLFMVKKLGHRETCLEGGT